VFLFISIFIVTVIFLNAFSSFQVGGFRPAGFEDRYPTFMVIVCCILNFILVDISIRMFVRLSGFFVRGRTKFLYAQLSHSIGCFLLFSCIPLFLVLNFDLITQPKSKLSGLLITAAFGVLMLIVAAAFCFPNNETDLSAKWATQYFYHGICQGTNNATERFTKCTQGPNDTTE
jgi:hypothetical protein